MKARVVRTHVVLPADLIASVDAMVGQRGRSRFLAAAVAEKLARERRATVLRDAAGALADRPSPGWDTGEETAAWLRRSRRDDDARLTRCL